MDGINLNTKLWGFCKRFKLNSLFNRVMKVIYALFFYSNLQIRICLFIFHLFFGQSIFYMFKCSSAICHHLWLALFHVFICSAVPIVQMLFHLLLFVSCSFGTCSSVSCSSEAFQWIVPLIGHKIHIVSRLTLSNIWFKINEQ